MKLTCENTNLFNAMAKNVLFATKVTDFEAWCAHLQLLISIHKLDNSLLNIIKFDWIQLLSLIGKNFTLSQVE